MKSLTLHHSPRKLGLGIAGLGLFAVLMTACNDKTTTPPGPCGDNNELCVSKQILIDSGTVTFANHCSGCHGEAGNGQGHGAPVLANSDYVMGSKARLIKTVLHGVTDTIYVNGQMYAGGGMPSWDNMLTNTEIAGILTYIRAVLNDSLVTDCVADPEDEFDITCTRTARAPADIANDSISVGEVKAVRDSIGPAPTPQ